MTTKVFYDQVQINDLCEAEARIAQGAMRAAIERVFQPGWTVIDRIQENKPGAVSVTLWVSGAEWPQQVNPAR